MAHMTTSDDVKVQLADECNVLIWSVMRTATASPLETATWLQIRDGRIAEIRTLFDPREAERNRR
ncbi:hypothetical protein ACGFSB_21980 [Streptomyces sp. NPDC048441]|uniref:hypothetical protein n=1 Tax=Streptomyces sp. NPDC048441 TaxID=3365552 RepID=UPI003724AF47